MINPLTFFIQSRDCLWSPGYTSAARQSITVGFVPPSSFDTNLCTMSFGGQHIIYVQFQKLISNWIMSLIPSLINCRSLSAKQAADRKASASAHQPCSGRTSGFDRWPSNQRSKWMNWLTWTLVTCLLLTHVNPNSESSCCCACLNTTQPDEKRITSAELSSRSSW